MQIKNLSMSFNTQELFSNINLHINENDKVGIVGVNGAGKTTFFKIVMGILEPDTGKIILENNARVEWLPQIIDEDEKSKDMTVLEFLSLGRPIDKLNEQLQDTYIELSNNKNSSREKVLFSIIDKLQKKLDYWDVYNAQNT